MKEEVKVEKTKQPRRQIVEETAGGSEVPEQKSQQVAERRQRRDLRKKVRVENDVPVVAVEKVDAPIVTEKPVQAEKLQNETPIRPLVSNEPATETVVENNENAENRENGRQRRLPRHLRVGNQRRQNRDNRQVKAMALVAAVVSPEAASGKILLPINVKGQKAASQEKSRFLSVDEMLEQQNQAPQAEQVELVQPEVVRAHPNKSATSTVPFGAVVSQHSDRDLVKEKHERAHHEAEQPTVESKPSKTVEQVVPFGAVVSQHSDRDLVKERYARTQRYKAQPTQAQAEESAPIAIVVPQSTYQSEYTFNGKIGTFSRVEHTKAQMTQAKAPEAIGDVFEITEWKHSRYYFHGKGYGGHTSAVSHVYTAPRVATLDA